MKYLLWGCLAACLLASEAGAKLVTKTIDYKEGGVTFLGHLAYEDTAQGRRPGILVFPEWWGLADFPKQKAEQLAKMGYVALAADMYGQGQTTKDPQEAAKLAGSVPADLMRLRSAAALQALKKQEMVDPDRIAAIGFCFGGNVAMQLAYSGADIKAAVSFHGNLTPPSAEEAKQIKARLLICTGAADPMVPPEKLRSFWDAMQETAVTWQANVYGGAKHSFTNPGSDKFGMEGLGYNAVAAERAWNDMQMIFREVFERPRAAQTRPS